MKSFKIGDRVTWTPHPTLQKIYGEQLRGRVIKSIITYKGNIHYIIRWDDGREGGGFPAEALEREWMN